MVTQSNWNGRSTGARRAGVVLLGRWRPVQLQIASAEADLSDMFHAIAARRRNLLSLALAGGLVLGVGGGGYALLQPDGSAANPPAAAAAGSGPASSAASVADTLPPVLEVEDAVLATSLREPFTLTGTVQDATAVQVEGADVQVHDGRFEARFATPPAAVTVVASDAAGNRTTRQVRVGVRHPGMRAVHMSALAWTSKTLREPILAQLKAGTIDTIELDVKDEDGIVGYDSKVPLAQQTGAAKGYYDARKAIDEIHGLGGRVVGRIVAFRDPKLGAYSWKNGQRERLVQTPGGSPYSGKYGAYSFVNPASPEVRQYNIDLAAEAAGLGFDDILYDYIRRPDGQLSKLRFPGMKGKPEQVIVSFVEQSRAAVRAKGAYLGVSVYGIAATRPTQIAQDIPGMAQHADFIAPMVYPSHWGPGEYGVRNPNAQPYEIVKRSLADFAEIVKGSNTQIMPWLQDFSLGVRYGPREVAAQIRGSKENGMDSFILWNAGSHYQWAGLR